MSAGRDPAVAAAHVCFALKATGLLRHREWTRRATGRNFMADRFCKLQIDDQLELGWLVDREIGRLCAAQPKPDSCAIPLTRISCEPVWE
jgi:hypothetical protein